MSSADLAHILTLCQIRFAWFVYLLISEEMLQVKHLLFCLFPSFKERLSLPIEVTVWANLDALFRCCCNALFDLGVQR